MKVLDNKMWTAYQYIMKASQGKIMTEAEQGGMSADKK